MIYLDNASTTLPKKEYLDLYASNSVSFFANSGSIHKLGLYSSRLLEDSRNKILNAFGIKNSHDLVFTNGATDSINLALKGASIFYKNRGNKIITSKVEHPATLETLKQIELLYGFKIVYLSVDETGKINPDELEKEMDNNVVLVSLLAVNNETGAINDVKKICEIVHKFPKAKVHIDATQAIGKVCLPYQLIDMFSYSGHKIHGLKGSGALAFKKNVSFVPVITGGGQEKNLKSGTVDVGLCSALAAATCDAIKSQKESAEIVKKFKDNLYDFFSNLGNVHINSDINTSPFILNVSLINKKASVVVEALSNKDIMVSSVSACHSKGEPISNVINEMFHDINLAKNTLRLSFDVSNTMEEINLFKEAFIEIINSIK